MQEYTPLVSIVVVTYNSSNTVIETLDSIKNQTYSNLELIITDDCSTDNTVDYCRQWLSLNESRFVRTKILTSEFNLGIPANCNKGYRETTGEWIKDIAGDDILEVDCIQMNINFSILEKNADVIFSRCRVFSGSRDHYNYGISLPSDKVISILNSSQENQLHELYKRNYLPPVTAFIRSSIYKENHFDEKYKSFEDYPYWIKLARKKIRFYFLDETTAKYRVGESLSQSKTSFIKEPLYLDRKSFYFDYIYNELRLMKENALLYYTLKKMFIDDFSIFVLRNKQTIFNRIILFFVKKIIHF